MLLATLLAPAPATAQGVTVSTLTDVGVFLSQHGQPWVRHVPADTPLTGSREINVSLLDAGATTGIYVDSNGVRLRETGNAVPGAASLVGTTNADPGPAPHSFRLSLPAGAVGKLRIRFVATALQLGSFVRASVDLGEDGTIDWSGTADGQVHVYELLLDGGAPTDVRITVHAHALAELLPCAYDVSLHVHHVATPTRCPISTYGRGCGPFLEGYEAGQGGGHRIDLGAWIGVPDTPGVLLFGGSPQNVPLADTGCSLLVTPLVAVPFRTDGVGWHRVSLVVPAPLYGPVFAQAASLWQLPTPLLQTTNGILLDFR